MVFSRPEHQIIVELLRSMNVDLLSRTQCFFGGGTAIVLQNGEYRLSQDVDFLCADADGYRELRTAAVRMGARAFFDSGVEAVRPFRADQYGIRGAFLVQRQVIKFEIIREARIALAGDIDVDLQVPVLCRSDQFAEKLLANADRGLDRSTTFRDAIDLGFLVGVDGFIPAEAIDKAQRAYGDDVPSKIQAVLRSFDDPANIRWAGNELRMNLDDLHQAIQNLRSAAPRAWPSMDFDEPAIEHEGLDYPAP